MASTRDSHLCRSFLSVSKRSRRSRASPTHSTALVGVVQRASHHRFSRRQRLLRVLGVDRAAFLQRDAFQIRCAVPVPFGAGAIGHEDIDLVAARLAGAFPVGVPRRVADYQQVDVALRACGPLGHRTEQHDLLRIGRRDDLGDRGVDPLLNRHFAPCYRVRSRYVR